MMCMDATIFAGIMGLVGAVIGGVLSYYGGRKAADEQRKADRQKSVNLLKLQLVTSRAMITGSDNVLVYSDSWIFTNLWVGNIPDVECLSDEDFTTISNWFSKLQRVKWCIDNNYTDSNKGAMRPMFARTHGQFTQIDYDNLDKIIQKLN